MEQLVVPASGQFPHVRFVHLGHAAGTDVNTRAILYNYAAARFWNHRAYLVAPSPAAEQDDVYFANLGRPLAATFSQGPTDGIAWRGFEGGVVALNTGSGTASIMGGCYQLTDPPRGYVFLDE